MNIKWVVCIHAVHEQIVVSLRCERGARTKSRASRMRTRLRENILAEKLTRTVVAGLCRMRARARRTREFTS